MEKTEIRKQISTLLGHLAKEKGYVTFVDIMESANKASLPADEFERLCDQVISAGIIILEEEDEKNGLLKDNDGFQYDKTQLDYNIIYKRILEIDNSLVDYIEKIKLIEPPQQGEEFILFQHAREGNPYARERLITMFLKVALRMALWHHDKFGLPLDETIQEANIGLLLALEKMPLDSDMRYTTYTPWWIRQNISRRTQGVSKTFYEIPVHVKDKLFIIIKIKKTHTCLLCSNTDYCANLINEICNLFGINSKIAANYLSYIDEPFSNEELIESKDEELLSDFGENIDNMNEKLFSENLREQLAIVLTMLKENERTVLELRYGLKDGIQRTLEEVGLIFGLTRERIRQIESKAFNKIRHPRDLKKNNEMGHFDKFLSEWEMSIGEVKNEWC